MCAETEDRRLIGTEDRHINIYCTCTAAAPMEVMVGQGSQAWHEQGEATGAASGALLSEAWANQRQANSGPGKHRHVVANFELNIQASPELNHLC